MMFITEPNLEDDCSMHDWLCVYSGYLETWKKKKQQSNILLIQLRHSDVTEVIANGQNFYTDFISQSQTVRHHAKQAPSVQSSYK